MTSQKKSSLFRSRRDPLRILLLLACLLLVPTHSFTSVARSFAVGTRSSSIQIFLSSEPDTTTTAPSVDSVEEASRILSEWDRMNNPDAVGQDEKVTENTTNQRNSLEACVRLLAGAAAEERNQDSTMGRCMLGICAPSAEEGVAALKAWVTALELPRGLLHGMDKDGVPIDLSGGVYIKYNSGGVYTFADIRKSGLGFDALWKPGDALLEPYDGTYRGVYFQVELKDDEFRQYLVPLDIF